MIQINPIILLLLGELLLVAMVVSVVFIARSVVRHRGDRAAAGKLISHIKEDDARRKEETRKIIQEQYGYHNQHLEDLFSQIDKHEKHFYQNFLNLYLKRNSTALENLHITFYEATKPYRSIELPANARSEKPGMNVIENEAISMEQKEVEIKRLSEENHQLSKELKTTMETMGTMVKEYAKMYSEQSNPLEPIRTSPSIAKQDVEPINSKQDKTAQNESFGNMGDDISVEVLDESASRDSDPDDIDYLIEEETLDSSNKQTKTSDNTYPSSFSVKDDDLHDLEVMPENEAVVNHSSDEFSQVNKKD